jgi:hypothetical protein
MSAAMVVKVRGKVNGGFEFGSGIWENAGRADFCTVIQGTLHNSEGF